jgi:hypothetical protein
VESTDPHPFDAVAARLQADLKVRFPLIQVLWQRDEDGMLVCEVRDGGRPWGQVGQSWWDDVEWSELEIENLIAAVAENITDNLWPDELTDPWPACPAHGNHPMAVGVVRGHASWFCRHDPAIDVRIGELGDRS